MNEERKDYATIVMRQIFHKCKGLHPPALYKVCEEDEEEEFHEAGTECPELDLQISTHAITGMSKGLSHLLAYSRFGLTLGQRE